MSTCVNIRKFEYSDLHAVHNLLAETISSCFPAIYPAAVVDFFLRYHSSEQISRRAQTGTLMVANLGNMVVGTGFLTDHEMGGVYVHPQHQHKHIGNQIVIRLTEIARDEHIGSVWLDATPLARPLYEKLDFQLLYQAVQMVGNVPLHYFRMSKDLA
jgi:putative acetyltransferase